MSPIFKWGGLFILLFIGFAFVLRALNNRTDNNISGQVRTSNQSPSPAKRSPAPAKIETSNVPANSNSNQSEKPNTNAEESQVKTPAQNPEAIEAQQLLAAYIRNPADADMNFKGRLLAITGIVKTISKSNSGEGHIVSIGYSARIDCEFAHHWNPTILALQKGVTVTLIGTCRGHTNWVIHLADCRFPSTDPEKVPGASWPKIGLEWARARTDSEWASAMRQFRGQGGLDKYMQSACPSPDPNHQNEFTKGAAEHYSKNVFPVLDRALSQAVSDCKVFLNAADVRELQILERIDRERAEKTVYSIAKRLFATTSPTEQTLPETFRESYLDGVYAYVILGIR
jgi:hypothetical protein